MEREVARAKVSANRVATVVANDWKDASDKVMPVKQWLDERRFLQACELLVCIMLLIKYQSLKQGLEFRTKSASFTYYHWDL